MRGPRITSGESHPRLDRLMQRWPARYGLAAASVGVVALLWLTVGHRLAGGAIMMALFGAMLVPAVLGGLGAGLLATVLVIVCGYWIPINPLDPSRVHLLGLQGVLMSVVGGAFRKTRQKASERLAANLRLEQQILEIGDEQRRRIGHDLHDGLGQHLTGISLLSETIAQQIETGTPVDLDNIETITRLVSDAVRVTRDLAKSLSPVTLERDGLMAAVEELAGATSALFNINCQWDYGGPDPPFDRTRALHLFRIIQEAVNNSIRHGKARNIKITFDQNAHQITVQILDDGSGLSEKTSLSPGLGLRIMQYRARMLGAMLSVERASPAGGTVVTCACPIDGQAPDR